MIRTAATTVLAAALLAAPAAAQRMSYGKAPMPGDTGPPAPEDVRFDQKLGAAAPLDLEFTDHDGDQVRLRDLTGGKPTLLVLAYYRCPKLCNEVLNSLLTALNGVRRADPRCVAGGPFNVVVVSIDPREDYHLAAAKRATYLADYDGRSPDQPGWWFLTASHGQGTDVKDADRKIHELAAGVGYQYSLRSAGKVYRFQPDSGNWVTTTDGTPLRDKPKDYDYQHASGVVVLGPDGTIAQYLPGLNYNPEDVRAALDGAAAGKVGAPVAQSVFDALPKCFVYDQVSKHYRPTMFFTALVAVPVMSLVLFIAYRAVRSGLRETPLTPGAAALTARPTASRDGIPGAGPDAN